MCAGRDGRRPTGGHVRRGLRRAPRSRTALDAWNGLHVSTCQGGIASRAFPVEHDPPPLGRMSLALPVWKSRMTTASPKTRTMGLASQTVTHGAPVRAVASLDPDCRCFRYPTMGSQ